MDVVGVAIGEISPIRVVIALKVVISMVVAVVVIVVVTVVVVVVIGIVSDTSDIAGTCCR